MRALQFELRYSSVGQKKLSTVSFLQKRATARREEGTVLGNIFLRKSQNEKDLASMLLDGQLNLPKGLPYHT